MVSTIVPRTIHSTPLRSSPLQWAYKAEQTLSHSVSGDVYLLKRNRVQSEMAMARRRKSKLRDRRRRKDRGADEEGPNGGFMRRMCFILRKCNLLQTLIKFMAQCSCSNCANSCVALLRHCTSPPALPPLVCHLSNCLHATRSLSQSYHLAVFLGAAAADEQITCQHPFVYLLPRR